MKPGRVISFLFAAALLLGLPLLGVWLAGLPVEQYAEFPPLTVYRNPAGFSWTAVAIVLAFQVPFWIPPASLLRVLLNRKSQIANRKSSEVRRSAFGIRHFPRWGWIALAWTATWWIIAWTRFPCFDAIQQHTFTPLWLGYIAVINATTFARSGRCMMTHEPRRLAWLFVASAFFWWFFEYLNRFVQNWHYEGIENFDTLRYVLFATPSFATVLPAVLSTAELLDSLTRSSALTQCRIRLPRLSRGGAWIMLLLSCFALGGIGIWPDYLFPLLWVAPLLILVALKAMRGDATIFAPVAEGNWRRLAVLSLAALICGFFWEMWNFHSEARWIYLVPFVGEWKLFEMPLLGFAGYLPFGWECAVIADALGRREPCASS